MTGTSVAELSDARRISALLMANSTDQGGMLMGHWPVTVIEDRISSGQSIVIATDDKDGLLGALLTQEKGFGAAPIVRAMLKAWPGGPDAYVYGPVCIAAEARGQGVFQALYAKLQVLFPGREAVLFIREDNRRSLQAHLRLGMREVAGYDFDGQSFIVLSDKLG